MPTASTARSPATRFPVNLDEAGLQGLMQDPRYWHPRQRDPAYLRLVERAFQAVYPDAGHDASGRLRRPPPRQGLQLHADGTIAAGDGNASAASRDPAANANESAEGAGGEIQVRSYTRMQNGEAVEVSAHTRGGGGHIASPERLRDIEAAAGKTWVGESRECVALVKHAVPGLGPTRNWVPGAPIRGPGDPPLAPGTAIAIFRRDGRYGNQSGESHAAIVIGETERDGQKGIEVWEQFKDKPAQKAFYPYEDQGQSWYKIASRYRVIETKK